MVAARRARPSALLMQAALTAAEHGHFVFPLRPRSKTPAFRRDWLLHASTDPALIRRMWRTRPCNIGIACAPSRLYVIDLDPAHGDSAPAPWTGLVHGRDVLAALAERSGHPYPGPTYTVATPSGGWHLYFRAPTAVRLPNTAGTLGWRIDTRGNGGYIVAAGSALHHGTYTVVNPLPPQPLPEWLITRLTPPPAHPSLPVDIGHTHRYVQVALRVQSDRVRHAPRGERHAILVSAAYSLGRLVGADILDDHGHLIGHGILDHQTAYDTLHDAARTHIGVEDFTDAEAERTITDGIDHGRAQHHQIRLRRP